MRPSPSFLRRLACGVLCLAASCASYPERTSGALRDFSSGQHAAALERYRDPDVTGSPFLSGVEAGTVALTAGRWEDALTAFSAAAELVRELEQEALLSPESLGDAVGGWIWNDTAQAYEGEGFERVMLHACLGLAYLALGKVDDAGVEVRLANRLLETEEELYSADYGAGGLGHLLSAVVYELRGEPDQAYIDYRRMADKEVGLAVAGPALTRIAEWLGRDDELALWQERFGPGVERPADAASVVLIAGVGLGPYKTERRLTVPLPGGLFSMAVPKMRARGQVVDGLRLVDLESGRGVLSAVVEDVTAVARANLEDRIAWSTAKSATRGVLKRELTRQLEREHGLAGRIAGDLFSFLTERADLRSWSTLPDTWQACRLFVPPGIRALRVEAFGGEDVDLEPVVLEPGETLFVFVRTLGRRSYVHAVGGGAVAEPPADP